MGGKVRSFRDLDVCKRLYKAMLDVNSSAENFFHTLKVELIHRMKFMTREEAKRKIFEYVEMYYNRKRAHSTLGYLSPFDCEKLTSLF